MKRRDIVIGVLAVLLLAGIVYWRTKSSRVTVEETNAPETLSAETQMEERFKVQIPSDVEKADLSGADGGNGSGLTTRKYESGKFTLSILSDLPDPEKGKFYQAWAVKGNEGDSDYSAVSLGKLVLAKGGWMLDYNSKTDLSDHDKVWVTTESSFDKKPESHVLEGGF